MNIHPLGKRAVITPVVKEKPKGSLIMPNEPEERISRGTVLAVNDMPYLHVGDTVLYPTYSAVQVSSDNKDEKILLIEEQHILGVIK